MASRPSNAVAIHGYECIARGTAGTTIELSGPSATMTFGGTNLAASVTGNSGKLKLLNDYELNLTHNYVQSARGTLQVELGSVTNVGKLNSTGTATLAGPLNVSLGSGFTPTASDVFTVLDAISLSGAFQNVADGHRLGTLGAEGSFLVMYNSGAGTVVLSNYSAVTLPSDFNGDGKVDGADYVVWRKSGLAPEAYNTWRTHFGTTSGSGSGTSVNAAVPEPSMLVPVVFAVAAWRLRRRQAA